MEMVKIASSDKIIIDTIERIKKTFLLEMWIDKSEAMLTSYEKSISKLKNDISDKTLAGIEIQNSECYIITSVTYFMRCFVEQHGFRLNAKEFIKEEKLQECFSKIEKLRHDEFVHWKGINSGVSLRFSLKTQSHNEFELAEYIDADFHDKQGPWDEMQTIKSLYETTRTHIKDKRHSFTMNLLKRLSIKEAFEKTNILNEFDQPIFIKADE